MAHLQVSDGREVFQTQPELINGVHLLFLVLTFPAVGLWSLGGDHVEQELIDGVHLWFLVLTCLSVGLWCLGGDHVEPQLVDRIDFWNPVLTHRIVRLRRLS